MNDCFFNLEAAIEFVKKNGEPFEQNFLYSLSDKKYYLEFEKQLSVYQNEDGGWTRLDADYKGNISSITCTIMALSKLNSLGMHGTLYEKTLNFLRSSQWDEGFWDEHEGIVQFNPPRWFYPNNLDNRIWFTNGLIRYLISLNCQDNELINSGKQFIRKYWCGNRLKGYGHNNWMAIVTFDEEKTALDKEIKQNCLNNLWDEAEGFDLFNLIWTMESFISLKMSITEPIVQRFFELVKQKGQSKDGGFDTDSGAQHRVDLTNRIIYTCLKFGLIVNEDIRV